MSETFEFEDRDHGGLPWHAITIVLIAGAVLTFASILVPQFLAPQGLPVLLAAGAGAGAILWLIGLAAGLRKAPLVWVLGALVLLAAGGTAAGYGADRIYMARGTVDASSFAETELGPDRLPKLPRGAAGRGNLSKAYADMLDADAEDLKAQNRAAGELNLAALESAYLLTQDPRALANCGRIAALTQGARDVRARQRARRAELAAQIDRAALSADTKRGVAMMILADVPESGEDAMLAHRLAFFDATQQLCETLAKRHWREVGGYFLFSDSGDRARAEAAAERRRSSFADFDRAQRDAGDRLLAGRELVRAELAR